MNSKSHVNSLSLAYSFRLRYSCPLTKPILTLCNWTNISELGMVVLQHYAVFLSSYSCPFICLFDLHFFLHIFSIDFSSYFFHCLPVYCVCFGMRGYANEWLFFLPLLFCRRLRFYFVTVSINHLRFDVMSLCESVV